MKYTVIYIFAALTSLVLAQSDFERQISENRDALEKVKSEIRELKKRITKADIQSSSTVEQIKLIDHELALLGKSKNLLTRKEKLLAQKVRATRADLSYRQNKLADLKSDYARWVVNTYKKGKVRDLSLVLNSESLNQALVRAKYLRFFSDQERRMIAGIRNEIAKIDQLNESLSTDLTILQESIREKETEELAYMSKKDKKRVLVKQLRWTSRNLGKQLDDKQAEYDKLYQIIVALEKQRKQREKSGERPPEYALDSKNFKKNKGKLPWPVKGTILHKYGKQRDATLKTTINNTGIDIRAGSGEKVSAVFTGVVSMITYLSGFGNTIILDHGGGYYSVYSHLDEVLVRLDDLVETGENIALVGDSGSLEGSKLHFALFSNQQTENPQNWLRN